MQQRSIRVESTDPGGPEELVVTTDDAIPEIGSTEVLVETEYCSINHPDLLMTRAGYQLKPKVPFTLGSEAIGVVAKRGAKVTSFQVGDVVLALTWHGAFSSHLILDGRPFQPRAKAMADVRARVTSTTLLRAPLSRVPLDLLKDKREAVVAMGFAYSAAYHALKDEGNLVAGEQLLVLGAAGGLGLAAIQIGLAMGADVVAVSRYEHELELCREQGAVTINYEQLLDEQRRESELGEFDVVFDVLGGKYTEPAIETLKPGGRLLVVGFAAGRTLVNTSLKSPVAAGKTSVTTKLPTNLLLRESKLVGSAWGSWASREPRVHVANLLTLYEWLRNGTINPVITKVFPLDEAAQALMTMRSGAIQGKVLLKS